MKKYLVIEEPIETRTSDVISEAYEQGLQNGYFEIIAEAESLEEARKILTENTIIVSSVRTAGGKRYSADLYYLEEQEWDEDMEEWETDLDSLEFAKIVETEEDEENEYDI